MYVLTDYDNIPPDRRTPRFLTFAKSVADGIVAALNHTPDRLSFRLYGGWYEDQIQTRIAQELAAELMDDFPCIYRPASRPAERTTMHAELAYSLLSNPTNHLLNTYRKKQVPHNIRVASPHTAGCMEAQCGLRHIKQLVRNKRCPENSCGLDLQKLIWRSEQKLVDVMLASDLLDLVAQATPDAPAMVTSDDDLWPALLLASYRVPRVLHIHAKPGATVSALYSRQATTAYTEISLG